MTVIDCTCSHRACESKGTYVLDGKCFNCGSLSSGRFTHGHDADDRTNNCPCCGCKRIYWNRGAS